MKLFVLLYNSWMKWKNIFGKNVEQAELKRGFFVKELDEKVLNVEENV